MSLVNTLAEPIKVKINNVEYTLPLLTIGDWAKLQKSWKEYNAQNIKDTVKSLVDSGLNTALVPALIRDLNKSCTLDELYSYVETPQGAIEVVYLSFQKSGQPKTRAEIENMLGASDVINIGITLLCLTDPYTQSVGVEDQIEKK